MIVSLEYDKVYPGVARPSFSDLFSSIPTTSVLEIIGHFSAMIFASEMDDAIQMDILTKWMNRLPLTLVNSISRNIAEIVVNHGDFVFFSNQTSLVFIEKALENYNNTPARALTPDEEEQLFKAYLLSSQEWIDNQRNSLEEVDLKTHDDVLKFALPVILPYDDLKKYRDFRWQIYKAIELFHYFENHNELKGLLPLFYSHYNIDSWNKYLIHVVGCIINLLQSGNKSILLTKDDDPINSIMDALALDMTSYSPKIDFISLREKPVYKSDNNRYLIYNYSLFIDKIFQAIQFDFGNILVKNKIVKNIPDFKTKYISKHFFEQFFLYQLADYIVGRRKNVIKLNGAEWEEKMDTEGPDYFVRCGTKIFMVEFKDAIFQAEAKLSHDYESIEKEIFKKLKENEKGKQKGITQLALWINEISIKGLPFDQFDKNQTKIYPILIVTDEAFNSFGINYLLNKEYRKMLTKESNMMSENLIVIHIDTLIELQDLFHDKRVPVHHCLNWYIDYVSNPKSLMDPFLSFSHFIPGELNLKGYKYNPLSRLINKELPKIF